MVETKTSIEARCEESRRAQEEVDARAVDERRSVDEAIGTASSAAEARSAERGGTPQSQAKPRARGGSGAPLAPVRQHVGPLAVINFYRVTTKLVGSCTCQSKYGSSLRLMLL